jgi:plastocyanin
MNMNILPTIRVVPLGGAANYTIALYNDANLTGAYSLAATAPSGLSLKFGSAPVNMTRAGPHFGTALVSSSNGTSPGTYHVTIVAAGAKGSANQTFDFYVQRNLVILSAMPGTPFFSNITVKAGDSVTWVSWDGPVGDDNPDYDYHHVIFLTGNLTSGLIDQFASWSHTFTQPGVYRYYDSITSIFPIKGEVIVTP